MNRPEIFRKRFIPEECTHLKDDILCYRDDNTLITRWKTLQPRPDFAGGISLYLLDKGYKISRITDASGNFIHYYCDIIHTDYYADKDTFIFTDLLADVLVFADGSYTILDLDELGDALLEKKIDSAIASEALHILDGLVKDIHDHVFQKYTAVIDQYL